MMTPMDLHLEFLNSVKRQQERGIQHYLEIPKKPYKAVRLYPNSGLRPVPPPEPSHPHQEKRHLPCKYCGEVMETQIPQGQQPAHKACRMEHGKETRRRTNCATCGALMSTRAPEGKPAYCRSKGCVAAGFAA